MDFDTLKQLIFICSGVIIVTLLFSIIINRKIFKYSFRNLINSISKKQTKLIFLRLFLIIFLSSLLFSFAYSCIDITWNIADKMKNNFFGKYQYAYISTNISKDINNLVSLQDEEIKNSQLRSGVYYNVAISIKDESIPNVVVLGLDNTDLKNGQFMYFTDGNKNFNSGISIYGNKLEWSGDNKTQLIDGLQNFRGWNYSTTSTIHSSNLIITDVNTALKVTGLLSNNIIFTDKKFDISANRLTKNMLTDEKNTYINWLSEYSQRDYYQGIFNSYSPFSTLMVIAMIGFVILLYPLYKTVRNIYDEQADNYLKLRSTGAPAGNVTKYLTYYFSIPFLIITIISSYLAYASTGFLYKVFDLSFIYNYSISAFPWSAITGSAVVANAISIFFVVVFLVFYSIYSPQNQFKPAKISMFKLTLGICSILFGITVLFFLNTLPSEAMGLIPFLIVYGPITSLLGSTIFLRLKNKWRFIVLIIALVIFILGTILLISLGKVYETPAGLVLTGLSFILLTTLIINEYSYKDYPKLFISSVFIFVITFILIISPVGLILDNLKYFFDINFQTSSAFDKNFDFDNTLGKENIKSKISISRAALLLDDQNGMKFVSRILEMVTVMPDSLTATNLTNDEKQSFYDSTDYVILSPEYKDIGLNEGQEIILQDIYSNQWVKKKIFKIMSDNINGDLSNRIIFPSLTTDFDAKKSTVNTIYLIKYKDNKNENIKNLKKILDKNNIFIVQDVEEKLNVSRNNSINIFRSLKYIVVILLIFVIFLCVTRDIIKGLIANVIIFVGSLIIAFSYEITITGNANLETDIVNLLMIIFISFIAAYGSNFAIRKIKNSK